MTRVKTKATWPDIEILWFKWIKTIYDEVAVVIEDDDDVDDDSSILPNIYNSDALNTFLLQLLVRIPMWSNVMCGVSGSINLNPTSSVVTLRGSPDSTLNWSMCLSIHTVRT